VVARAGRLTPPRNSPHRLARRPQDIDEKATVLADSAKTFQKSATAAKRMMRCRYWKMIILFTIIIAVILTIIIVPLVQKNQ
jgi:type IV secretory pathway component VirB8